MPTRPRRRCARAGCSNYEPCERHARKPWRGSKRKGSTRRGRRVRARILARDPVCVICGERPASVCDHVRQVADGAAEDYADVPEDELRGICDVCDRRLSAKQGAKARHRR